METGRLANYPLLNLDNSLRMDNEQERPRHDILLPLMGILYRLAWTLLITYGGSPEPNSVMS